MEIESGNRYHVGEIESAQRKCKCKYQNYEAWLTHEERDEPALEYHMSRFIEKSD